MARAFGGLRDGTDFSGDKIGNGLREQFCAELRQPVVELWAAVGGTGILSGRLVV